MSFVDIGKGIKDYLKDLEFKIKKGCYLLAFY